MRIERTDGSPAAARISILIADVFPLPECARGSGRIFGGGGLSITTECREGAQSVAAFFKQTLPARGWKLQSQSGIAETGAAALALTFKKENQTAQVVLMGTTPEKTSINIKISE